MDALTAFIGIRHTKVAKHTADKIVVRHCTASLAPDPNDHVGRRSPFIVLIRRFIRYFRIADVPCRRLRHGNFDFVSSLQCI